MVGGTGALMRGGVCARRPEHAQCDFPPKRGLGDGAHRGRAAPRAAHLQRLSVPRGVLPDGAGAAPDVAVTPFSGGMEGRLLHSMWSVAEKWALGRDMMPKNGRWAR